MSGHLGVWASWHLGIWASGHLGFLFFFVKTVFINKNFLGKNQFLEFRPTNDPTLM